MQPITPTPACPHCGSQNGFITDIVFKAKKLTGWDGADIDTDEYQVVTEKNPACSSCGKSVRRLFKT